MPRTHITPKEAAEKLGGVTNRRIKQLIAAGRLTAIRIEAGEYKADRRVRVLITAKSLTAYRRRLRSRKR